MKFGNFRAMAHSSKMPFPEKLYCDSSSGDLIGSYLLVDSRSRDFSKLLVSHEAVSPYVYLNANRTHSNLLVYCEGTPDLIPADMWRSVITEALSRNPRAALAASMQGEGSEDAAVQICADIKRVAMSACRDLVGWIIFTERGGMWGITARCVRNVDPDTPTTVSASPLGSTGRFSKLTSECSNVWEVRSKSSSPTILPWMMNRGGLDARWLNLISQVGCFDTNDTNQNPVSVVLRPITTPSKDSTILPTVDESTISSSSLSTMVSPPGSPVVTSPSCGFITQVAENKFCWEISKYVCEEFYERISPTFQYKDEEYLVRVSAPSPLFLKVSLVRCKNEGSKKCDVKFSVMVEAGSGMPPLSSGWKRMGPEGIFEVLFDRSRRMPSGDDVRITLAFDNGP